MANDTLAFLTLHTLNKSELLAAWTELIGERPSDKASRDLLLNALAWHIQERKHGGLRPAVKRRLESLASSYAQGKPPPALKPSRRLRPGITLIKEWRGKTFTVTAIDDGFAYLGKRYRSLSEIARVITGTRWNGPAFFGLRKGNGSTGGGDR